MDAALVYFLIQIGAIICINTVFFVFLLVFAIVIAVFQFWHNRYVQTTLENAIEDAKEAFADPDTYTRMTKALVRGMRQFLGSKWSESKKTLEKVVSKTKGKKKAWYMALGEVILAPKGKRGKIAAKNIGAIVDPLMKKTEADIEKKAAEPPTPEEYAKQMKEAPTAAEYKKAYEEQHGKGKGK